MKSVKRRVAIAACLGLVAAGCGGSHHAAQPPPRPRPTPLKPTPQSIVATAVVHEIPVYRSLDAHVPFVRLTSPASTGVAVVFLVRQRRAARDQVYLPVRPDGVTGWIDARDVTLAVNPYSIQVRLRAHSLVVRKAGRIVTRLPAAVGRTTLPTPTGTYYIVNLLKQPDPAGAYGPYAFGLSGFSHVLYHFGGGIGQIAIHGTDEPASIGHNESQGCVRIANDAVTRLAHVLPLGTPVTIRD